MGKCLGSLLLNPNSVVGKISHWRYLVALNVPKPFSRILWSRKEELATCLQFSQSVSTKGTMQIDCVICFFGSFIVLFSLREEQLVLTSELFSSKLESHPWVTFILCIAFLCARCSWWRQWKRDPKRLSYVFHLFLALLFYCHLLFFENLSTVLLFANLFLGQIYSLYSW